MLTFLKLQAQEVIRTLTPIKSKLKLFAGEREEYGKNLGCSLLEWIWNKDYYAHGSILLHVIGWLVLWEKWNKNWPPFLPEIKPNFFLDGVSSRCHILCVLIFGLWSLFSFCVKLSIHESWWHPKHPLDWYLKIKLWIFFKASSLIFENIYWQKWVCFSGELPCVHFIDYFNSCFSVLIRTHFIKLCFTLQWI